MSSFKGMTTREAMANPVIRSKLSILMVAGNEDSKGLAEGKRMHKAFESSRPKVDEEDQREKLDLFLAEAETSLTGTKLLGNGVRIGRSGVAQYIANFINLRLVAKQEELAWTDRTGP
jgi:hypothetical protein